MSKFYESPEFEIVKINLSNCVLNISEGESGQSGGVINDPGEEEP